MSNTTNPAQPYEDLLSKYLPGVQLEVRDCWAMYSFDPAQLAALIQHVEDTVRQESPHGTYRYYDPSGSGNYVDLPKSE